MAVIKLRPANSGGYTSVPVVHGPEEASQTYEKGAVVIPDATSNEVEQASTEPVNNIIGVAAGAASGTAGTDVLVYKAAPGAEFLGSIGTSTSAGAIAATDLFELYPLALSSGDWFVDKTDNTNPCVRVIELIDDVGTVNGTVKFEFLKSTTLYED